MRVLQFTKGGRLKNYHISIYVIVPIVFSCLSLLSLVITYTIVTRYLYQPYTDPFPPVLIWAMAIMGFTFLLGLLIARIILKPVEEFVEQAEKLPGMMPDKDVAGQSSGDELKRFAHVFDQLTDFLSKVDAREQFPGIIGQSKIMRGVMSQILKVAPTDVTVLITGESGTGKEVMAQAIYEHSKRKNSPIAKINCAAIPDGLLESEFFGHEKGAFTGAGAKKIGKLEAANNGTVFLDEIGDMPLSLQGKILRVIENKSFERVGGTATLKVDVRFIAATNRNLEKMVDEGGFREDLYYRLNVVSIHLPPLRNRKEDVPLFAQHFLSNISKNADISPKAMDMLMLYDWPGNVRELQNIIERAAVACGQEQTILPKHVHVDLEKGPLESGGTVGLPDFQVSGSLDEYLAEIEKKMLINSLRRTGGVQVRAAELLGIKERSFWHRLSKYNIRAADFKGNKN